jgi:hypothetical protein
MAQAFLLRETGGRKPQTADEKVGRCRWFGNSHRLFLTRGRSWLSSWELLLAQKSLCDSRLPDEYVYLSRKSGFA